PSPILGSDHQPEFQSEIWLALRDRWAQSRKIPATLRGRATPMSEREPQTSQISEDTTRGPPPRHEARWKQLSPAPPRNHRLGKKNRHPIKPPMTPQPPPRLLSCLNIHCTSGGKASGGANIITVILVMLWLCLP